MGNRKILIWNLAVIILVILTIKHSEESKIIEYDLTGYGGILIARQFDDGKILIATLNEHSYLLYFIYQNGSIIPVNYEHSINLSNSSRWLLHDLKPLATDH
ncbi:14008_t:CDS:1, partial [Racocetra persica]